MTGSVPDLSVSIVSLDRPDLVRACLASLATHTRSLTYDIHLVAHDWSDPAALRELQAGYPNLVVHRVGGIRGYSQNNNLVLRAARGRYVAILNDDTLFASDVLGSLVRVLEGHADVAAACPVLLNPDGSLQLGLRGKLTPWSLVLQQVKLDRLLPAAWARRLGAMDRPWLPDGAPEVVDIEAGTGACFVARRTALAAIGFLDEAYHLGPDDIDWTRRLRRDVGRVVLVRRAVVTHLAGSTLGRAYAAALPTIYAGYYTYLRRYYGRLAEWAIRLGLGLAWSAVLAGGWAVVALVSRSARARVLARARWNCVRYSLSGVSSSAVFSRLHQAG